MEIAFKYIKGKDKISSQVNFLAPHENPRSIIKVKCLKALHNALFIHTYMKKENTTALA